MLLFLPFSNESDIQIYSIWKCLVELLIAFLHSKRITRGWAEMCFNPLLKTALWPMSNLIQSKKQLQKPPQYSVYCDPFQILISLWGKKIAPNLFIEGAACRMQGHRYWWISALATSLEALSDISVYPPLSQINMYHFFHGWLLVYKNRCSWILIVFLPG